MVSSVKKVRFGFTRVNDLARGLDDEIKRLAEEVFRMRPVP